MMPGEDGGGASVRSPRLGKGAHRLFRWTFGQPQKLADLFAETKQIATAPRFADWVDHRYDDALKPLVTNPN